MSLRVKGGIQLFKRELKKCPRRFSSVTRLDEKSVQGCTFKLELLSEFNRHRVTMAHPKVELVRLANAPLVCDLTPPRFKLILCDTTLQMCKDWQWEFSKLASNSEYLYEIRHGSFTQIPDFDCIVSPANSFGLMDGGIDLAISKFFGGTQVLVPRVQKQLMEEFCGIQPVGSSFIVETGSLKHPYIAHTPTMFIPEKIQDKMIVYRCMYSMLAAVRAHNLKKPEAAIKSVVCSGLGTGCGKVSAEDAARLMALAFKHFTHHASKYAERGNTARESPYLVSWDHALNLSVELE